jgi:hypothetical protein
MNKMSENILIRKRCRDCLLCESKTVNEYAHELSTKYYCKAFSNYIDRNVCENDYCDLYVIDKEYTREEVNYQSDNEDE